MTGIVASCPGTLAVPGW